MQQRWTLNVRGFGRLGNAQLRLAPCMLLVGENNTGKISSDIPYPAEISRELGHLVSIKASKRTVGSSKSRYTLLSFKKQQNKSSTWYYLIGSRRC